MKIICEKKDLSDGINIALKSVPSKTTMPILECFAIRVMQNTIRLTSNDMELGIETEIKGNIEEEGSVLVDAKMFGDIIRKLSDEEVSIHTDENDGITIQSGKSIFHVNGLNSSDFPFLPSIDREKSIRLSQFTLKEMIRQTVFSVSDNEKNRLMTGELFEVRGDELRITSLDGHRISIRSVKLKERYDSIKVIVPGKTLTEISKILSSDMDEDVDVYFTDKHVLFEFGHTMVLSRLIEGEYYAVEKMLTSHYETKIIVNRMELLNCIERANLLIRDTDRKPLIIQVTDEKMQIKMNTKMGSMDEDIEIEKEGKDITIAFNPKFFIESLRVIEDEEVYIYMINQKAPCIIKDSEVSYIYLILPINSNQV